MILHLVAFLLFVGGRGAVESTQTLTVSQRCLEDTNTFLREINQDEPKGYAVLSKWLWFLYGISYALVWQVAFNPL